MSSYALVETLRTTCPICGQKADGCKPAPSLRDRDGWLCRRSAGAARLEQRGEWTCVHTADAWTTWLPTDRLREATEPKPTGDAAQRTAAILKGGNTALRSADSALAPLPLPTVSANKQDDGQHPGQPLRAQACVTPAERQTTLPDHRTGQHVLSADALAKRWQGMLLTWRRNRLQAAGIRDDHGRPLPLHAEHQGAVLRRLGSALQPDRLADPGSALPLEGLLSVGQGQPSDDEWQRLISGQERWDHYSDLQLSEGVPGAERTTAGGWRLPMQHGLWWPICGLGGQLLGFEIGVDGWRRELNRHGGELPPKYKLCSSSRSALSWRVALPDGTTEPPLACWGAGGRPLHQGELAAAGAVLITEGRGVKPRVSAARLGVPVVGGGGHGAAASAPQQLTELLRLTPPSCRVLVALDAGGAQNPGVLRELMRTAELVRRAGREPFVLWWGQAFKAADGRSTLEGNAHHPRHADPDELRLWSTGQRAAELLAAGQPVPLAGWLVTPVHGGAHHAHHEVQPGHQPGHAHLQALQALRDWLTTAAASDEELWELQQRVAHHLGAGALSLLEDPRLARVWRKGGGERLGEKSWALTLRRPRAQNDWRLEPDRYGGTERSELLVRRGEAVALPLADWLEQHCPEALADGVDQWGQPVGWAARAELLERWQRPAAGQRQRRTPEHPDHAAHDLNADDRSSWLPHWLEALERSRHRSGQALHARRQRWALADGLVAQPEDAADSLLLRHYGPAPLAPAAAVVTDSTGAGKTTRAAAEALHLARQLGLSYVLWLSADPRNPAVPLLSQANGWRRLPTRHLGIVVGSTGNLRRLNIGESTEGLELVEPASCPHYAMIAGLTASGADAPTVSRWCNTRCPLKPTGKGEATTFSCHYKAESRDFWVAIGGDGKPKGDFVPDRLVAAPGSLPGLLEQAPGWLNHALVVADENAALAAAALEQRVLSRSQLLLIRRNLSQQRNLDQADLLLALLDELLLLTAGQPTQTLRANATNAGAEGKAKPATIGQHGLSAAELSTALADWRTDAAERLQAAPEHTETRAAERQQLKDQIVTVERLVTEADTHLLRRGKVRALLHEAETELAAAQHQGTDSAAYRHWSSKRAAYSAELARMTAERAAETKRRHAAGEPLLLSGHRSWLKRQLRAQRKADLQRRLEQPLTHGRYGPLELPESWGQVDEHVRESMLHGGTVLVDHLHQAHAGEEQADGLRRLKGHPVPALLLPLVLAALGQAAAHPHYTLALVPTPPPAPGDEPQPGDGPFELRLSWPSGLPWRTALQGGALLLLDATAETATTQQLLNASRGPTNERRLPVLPAFVKGIPPEAAA